MQRKAAAWLRRSNLRKEPRRFLPAATSGDGWPM